MGSAARIAQDFVAHLGLLYAFAVRRVAQDSIECSGCISPKAYQYPQPEGQQPSLSKTRLKTRTRLQSRLKSKVQWSTYFDTKLRAS